MNLRRRHLLGGVLLGTAGFYAYQRGLRYPRLSLEHAALSAHWVTPEASYLLDGLTVAKSGTEEHWFRAMKPEPSLHISSSKGELNLSVNNIATNAKLHISGNSIKLLDEQVDGITRHVKIDSAIEQQLTLSWSLPAQDGLDFAVMGDTGGGDELDWTLTRAKELGAQFLLHLGDFNYSRGEYQQAIDKFYAAPIPCYITIGNHDFHHSGLIYQRFLDYLGPMNYSFTIAGSRFVNIDTAADFFPAHSGQRGKLMRQLIESPFSGEQIFFTHRPIKDPRPHDDHEIGGVNEIDWLINALHKTSANTLLTGHVHHSAELDFNGIHQFTIGEGLGHENLVLQKPVAKIMLGRVEPGKAFSYQWVDLNMPWKMHTSPTHAFKLKRDGRNRQLDWYRTLLDLDA